MRITHYGNLNCDSEGRPRFRDFSIRDMQSHWTGKPHGKCFIYGSPVNSRHSWFRYCQREKTQYLLDMVSAAARWEITIDTERARVYTISNWEDARDFSFEYHLSERNGYDWIRFVMDWDVLHVKPDALSSLDHMRWDCETVVIFHPSVISHVTKRRSARLYR